MTTGATGQLGLALPVQGELSGTWGDTVNNGITQYTNIAIAATLTLTGDGAVTLTNTTGDATASNITSSLSGAGTVTAQFAIVKISGTLTTTKVVTFGSAGSAPYSKTYLVVNAATGGTVTFKAYGQTGVSIAVGESALVYYNGTDIVKLVGTATGGAAGGSTTQVQYNSSGSLAGSANMTFDGTSMTLGGNPTLSAGTASGVTYLNGSKVLTSGSALTFDGTKQVVVGSSASALELLRLSNTESTGKQSIIGFLNAGLSNPTTKIYGGGTSNSGNGAFKVALTNESGTEQSIYESLNSVYAATAYSAWGLSGSELMRLTSTGLGIGTSSPATKLNLYGSNVPGVGQLKIDCPAADFSQLTLYVNNVSQGFIRTNASALDIGTSSSTPFTFHTNANERMRLDSAGNLGLGVTPSAWGGNYKVIQTAGGSITQYNGGSIGMAQNFYDSGVAAYKYINTAAASYYYQTTGSHVWLNAPSGTAGNAITFTQAMTLDSSGNLLVGGTAARGTTVGSAHLDLFNGTAPAGTLTNGVSLYSSSGDLKFMDSAGNAYDVGFRNIPQNAQTGSYTMVLADAGKHIYHASGAGAATYTIPANGSVAYAIGTAITFINLSTTSISIAITTDTMYLSSAGTTGTRTLAQYGSATAIKVTATVWLISGSGLT